ncbi:MAG: hypothetical protein AAB152_08465 [Candidatus Coatesbacteria bacterium]
MTARWAVIAVSAMLAAGRVGAVTAGSEEVVGADNVAGTFLLRGVGGRAAGMGEAFGAVADDASAGSWNPAGLSRVDRAGGVLMYDAAGEGLGLRYAAVGGPVGVGSASLSLTAMTYGGFDAFDEQGVRTGWRSPVDIGALAGWGWRHPAWFGDMGGVGIAGEFVSTTTANRFLGLSAGVIYQLAPGTAVGMAVQHVSTHSDGYALPGLFRFSWTSSPMAHLRVAADGVQGLVDRERWISGGAEAFLSRKLALRAGYKWSPANSGVKGLTGVTAGVGVRLRNVEVDYAYQPVGYLTTSHRLSLGYRARGGSE